MVGVINRIQTPIDGSSEKVASFEQPPVCDGFSVQGNSDEQPSVRAYDSTVLGATGDGTGCVDDPQVTRLPVKQQTNHSSSVYTPSDVGPSVVNTKKVSFSLPKSEVPNIAKSSHIIDATKSSTSADLNSGLFSPFSFACHEKNTVTTPCNDPIVTTELDPSAVLDVHQQGTDFLGQKSAFVTTDATRNTTEFCKTQHNVDGAAGLTQTAGEKLNLDAKVGATLPANLGANVGDTLLGNHIITEPNVKNSSIPAETILDTNLDARDGTNCTGQSKPGPKNSFADLFKTKINIKSGKGKLKFIPPVITESGSIIAMVPDDLILKQQLKWATTLYGYFVGKRLAFPIVNYHCNRLWKQYGLMDIILNDMGYYNFKFKSEDGMKSVMENGPCCWIMVFLCWLLWAFIVNGILELMNIFVIQQSVLIFEWHVGADAYSRFYLDQIDEFRLACDGVSACSCIWIVSLGVDVTAVLVLCSWAWILSFCYFICVDFLGLFYWFSLVVVIKTLHMALRAVAVLCFEGCYFESCSCFMVYRDSAHGFSRALLLVWQYGLFVYNIMELVQFTFLEQFGPAYVWLLILVLAISSFWWYIGFYCWHCCGISVGPSYRWYQFGCWCGIKVYHQVV